MKIKQAEFVISNSDHKLCPTDGKPEFAFIGRSNVGKSSLINMLVGNKGLAKTSGRPGKTQLINHFVINNEWYLVDLPGYGYAKASKVSRAKWEIFIAEYLTKRAPLLNLHLKAKKQTKDHSQSEIILLKMKTLELRFSLKK